jgi:hypothetical protein
MLPTVAALLGPSLLLCCDLQECEVMEKAELQPNWPALAVADAKLMHQTRQKEVWTKLQRQGYQGSRAQVTAWTTVVMRSLEESRCKVYDQHQVSLLTSCQETMGGYNTARDEPR